MAYLHRFRRSKWWKPGDPISLIDLTLNYRVSLIAAIDTKGEVFTALTSVNTDSNLIIVFLNKLIPHLVKRSK